MRWRTFFLELAAIVSAAVLCALVANTLAARERKLALVGSYPNAMVIPHHDGVVPATPEPVATASSPPLPMMNPLPAQVPAVLPAVTATSSAVTSTMAAAAVPRASTAPVSTATKLPAAEPHAASHTAAADLLARFPPHEKTPYAEIGAADVDWLFAQGATFLDARRTDVYAQGHIPGARSFSVWESDVDDKVKQLLDEGRDQKLPIVVYCSGGDCEDSHMLAEKLWGVFFNNVLVYKDGFPDWQKRGRSIHTGSAP